LADRPDVYFIKDGKLACRAIPNPYQDEDPVPMITGGVKSQGKFAFTYGKVECRALSNPWIGNFPAIWMMPADNSKGWPNAGEIDIWEVIDTDERSYHTIHSNWTYNLHQGPQSSFNTPVKLDRYHTYGLEWDETSLKWYVDGKLVGTYNKSTDSNALNQGQWPFNKHFYLILNQSVGNGAWAKPADVNHTYETTFDWIRVYQKKGQQNTDGTVGIEEVTNPSEPTIEVVKGGVTINSSLPQMVNIYDLSGRLIISRNIVGDSHLNLNEGIYLVNGEKIVIR
jgi:beta-glucanase (GH16 family)